MPTALSSEVAVTADFYAGMVCANARDISELEGLLRKGTYPKAEDPEADLHLNRLIPKPWGYEYRAYADHMQDVWQLCLRPGQRTSMHAHPRKVTYLMCLAGEGKLAGLGGEQLIATGDIVRIDRGAFHQTTNTSTDTDLHLLEVETPRNKFDLVRLQDDYNRVGKGYETESADLATEFKKIPYIPGGRMCKYSPQGHFEYSVTSGMDLYYRGVKENDFHIPIGVPALLATHMIVLGSSSTGDVPPLRDTYYLTVHSVQ